jgi:hypothetical protein
MDGNILPGLSGQALRIEHAVTADMPDGQPLPPFIEGNVVSHVVRRLPNARTLWRRIALYARRP